MDCYLPDFPNLKKKTYCSLRSNSLPLKLNSHDKPHLPKGRESVKRFFGSFCETRLILTEKKFPKQNEHQSAPDCPIKGL